MANYLTSGDLMSRLKIKRSSFYKLIRECGFPRPTIIGGARRWSETQVQQWLDQQISGGAA